MKIRRHLMLLVVAAILPAIVFAGTMIVILGNQERRAVERGLLDTTRALSLAVDREFEASIRALQALATSKHLDAPDLREFYQQSARVKAETGWSTIILFDTSQRQLLNLLRPFGSVLPTAPPTDSGVKDTMELGRPFVSNLFFARLPAESRIAVNVPVIRDGKVKYVLGANFSPMFLMNLVKQQSPAQNWFASIVDRNKIVVVRTRDWETFSGTRATKNFIDKTGQAKEMTWRGTTLDKSEVYAAAVRSDLTGWTVALGMPTAEVEAPMQRSLILIAIGSALLLNVAFLLATGLGRRIAKSIVALAGSAKLLGGGSIPQPADTAVAEVNDVGRTIVDAAISRKRMEEALRKSEERFQLVARATNDILWDWDLTTNSVWWNEGIRALFGYSRDEVQPGVEWWSERVHPEDRQRVEAKIDAMVHGSERFLSEEYRFRRADGSYAYVSDTGYLLHDDGKPVRMIGAMVDITERRMLEEERARLTDHLRALADAARAIHSLESLDETLEIITNKARNIIGAHASVTSLTVGNNWAQALSAISLSDKYAAYRDFDAPPDGSGIYAVVCETNKPLRLTQAALEAHTRWRNFGAYADKHPPLRGWLAVPLVGRDGRNLGLLQVTDKYEGDFTATDEAMLVQFAQLAGIAIENARLFKELAGAKEQSELLSHRLVNVQEAERRAVARELHDEVGQVLTGIKFSIEASMRKHPGWQDELEEIRVMANDLIGRVQDLSLELRPTVLDDFGLLPGLEWQCHRYTAQTKLDIDFVHAGLESRRFEPEIEIAAYRIVQEALTNVARHAQVEKVAVEVVTDENTLRIVIKDFGVGFDVESLPAGAMVGLSGMRERAVMLGGALKIQSAPGMGTVLTAELPLMADDADGTESRSE